MFGLSFELCDTCILILREHFSACVHCQNQIDQLLSNPYFPATLAKKIRLKLLENKNNANKGNNFK